MKMNISTIQRVFQERLYDLQKKWGYYNSDPQYIPVYSRVPASPLKESTETRIHADFFSDIIDMKVGYMGSKIYATSPLYQDFLNTLEEENNLNTMNVESIRMTSSTGISHRLIYNDRGVLKLRNVEPWKVIYDYTDSIFNPTEAYYFYDYTTLEGMTTYYCNVYDNQNVSYYQLVSKNTGLGNVNGIDSNGEGVWVPRNVAQDGTASESHLFSRVPMIPFINNGQLKGNCDKVIDAIDSYDNVMSDIVSEIRASRLAYLKVWGQLNTSTTDSDGNTVEWPVSDWLKQFGTMLFGMDDEGNKFGDASFLEKKLDDQVVEHQLNRLRTQIYEQSHGVDLRELTDAAQARVFTVKACMMRMETDAQTTETFIKKALDIQYDLIEEWCNLAGIPFDSNDISIFFARSFPVDLDTSATALQKLLQVLPVKKAYSLSDLIEATEIDTLAEEWEKQQNVDLFAGKPEQDMTLPVMDNQQPSPMDNLA
jgi:SPP1 family phage portal protein